MRNAKTWLAGFLALTLVLSFVACAAEGSAPASTASNGTSSAAPAAADSDSELSGTLNMVVTWNEPEANALQELGEAFMVRHPNVTIVTENLGTNSNEVINSRDAAGNLPDIFPVFNLGPKALGSWVSSGKLADISGMPLFQQLPEETRTKLSDEDGKAYAMVMDLTSYLLMWNKDLFAQAGITERPDTLDKLADAVDKLNAAGIQPFAIGAKDGWTLSNCLWRPGLDYAFAPEWNADMYAGNASFSDGGQELFPLLDLVIANSDESILDVDYTTAQTQFGLGEAAMMINGPWIMDYITGNIDPDFYDKVDAVSLPWSNDAENNKMWLMQRTGLVFSAQADLEIANAFLEFWVNDPEGQAIMEPYMVNASYFENMRVNDDVISQSMQEAVKSGDWVFDFQDNNRSPEWFMIDWTGLQDYAAGRLTKDKLLANMDASWAEITAKEAT